VGLWKDRAAALKAILARKLLDAEGGGDKKRGTTPTTTYNDTDLTGRW